jgi:Rrf2 family protein
MLLTRASEYALLSLAILSHETKPLGADKLALRLNISKSFLAKVLQALAREKIVKSYRGTGGGFMLARYPKEITIKEIIVAAEKKVVEVFFCSSNKNNCPSNKGEFCNIWKFLNHFQNRLSDFLQTMTLQDLVDS